MRALITFVFLASAAPAVRAQTLEMTDPLASVSFDSGSAQVDGRGREQLRAVVAWAHDHPWRLVAIQGYADRSGDSATNLRLSQDRTDAVRADLIDLGMDPDRIVAVAYGEGDRPVRRVVVRGTLGDFRELLERQTQVHTPAPRGTPGAPTRPYGRPQARPQAQPRPPR